MTLSARYLLRRFSSIAVVLPIVAAVYRPRMQQRLDYLRFYTPRSYAFDTTFARLSRPPRAAVLRLSVIARRVERARCLDDANIRPIRRQRRARSFTRSIARNARRPPLLKAH